MLSQLRIVTLVRLQLAVLAALLLVTAGLSLVEAWQARSSVLRVERVNAAVDALLAATESLAIERGTTNTALRGEAPVSAEVRGQIDARRALADPALAEAFTILEGLSLPDARDAAAALRQRLEALQRLRTEADAALTRSRTERPEATVTGWMPTVIAAMEAVSDLSIALGREVRLTDPQVAEQVQVKQLAWAVRDAAGRERATIGGALASGAGLGEAQRAAIAALRGRVDFGWEQIREIAGRPGGDPRLAAQVAATGQAYFEVFRSRSDAVIQASGEGSAAPMTGPAWYDLSNPALATLMAVKDASIAVTADITAGQRAQATRAMALQLGLLAAAAVVLLGAVLATQRRLARPVQVLTGAIAALARQDYDRPVPLRERRDELGIIAGALDGLREEGLRARQLAAEREAEQAAALARSQRIETLTRGFEAKVSEALGRSLRAAERVHGGAGSLSAAAERADGQARHVGQASDQASSNVQTVAAASEELAASIREINQQIVQSRVISDEAVAKARETSASVAGLSEVAARIDAVIGLITGIAEQTNLLALNATIEAARAGEAGRGFAVVASEVKSLANQTSKATEEIAAQIHAMQGSTGEVVTAVDGIGATIGRLSEFVATIAAAAEEQGAATQEIARNVQQAAMGTQQVNDGMAEVRAVSQTTNGLAGELLALSDELGSQATSLRAEIDGFLQAVRVA